MTRPRLGRWLRSLPRWIRILLAGRPAAGEIHVSYGRRIPGPDELAWGGMIKFQKLDALFSHCPERFNVLYLGSNTLPRDWRQLLAIARRKGARVVYNQDGVGYRAWHGPGWQKINEPMARMIHAADHVFYQSEFSKLCADRFLGERKGGWEILHNPVDTDFFTPATHRPPAARTTLLLGGNQYLRYALESALETVALVARERPDVELLIAGRLDWTGDPEADSQTLWRLSHELGVRDRVRLTGPYHQSEAPEVYRGAQVLLHTRCNDVCPTAVIEAMACGLPVVYAASGGVPEIVGPRAGLGIATVLDWEKIHPPDPRRLAQALLQVLDERRRFAEAARRRAVERFHIAGWLARHREVFLAGSA